MSLKNRLSLLWHKLVHFFTKLPVSIRVTLWYTLFLALVLAVFTGAVLEMAEDHERRDAGKDLIKAVDKASQDPEHFRPYDKNVYLSLRDPQGKLLSGMEPEGMPALPPRFNRGPQKIVIDGQSYHYVDQPIRPALRQPGTVLSPQPLPWIRGILPDEIYARRYQVILLTALISLPLFLLLIALGGYRIIRHSFAPVQAISEAARAIGETGDLSQRIPLGDGKGEIHQMGHTFNWMLAQLEEQLEREKHFTSDVSHELRTPTAVIMAESEYGKDYTETVAEAKEEFQHIFQQSRRMSRLINQLLELSRLDSRKDLVLGPVKLSQLVTETLEDYQKLPAAQNFAWKLQVKPDLTVTGNDQLLARILGNYLDNALKFAKHTIQVSLCQEKGRVVLAVSDDGPGIPPEDLPRIWNRLYQADPSRNKKQNLGLGLGLSFVAAAAKLQKAQAGVTSTLGKGSTFTLKF